MAGHVSLFYAVLNLSVVPILAGASGQIELRIRDAQTGYSVPGVVRLDGPESMTLQQPANGRIIRALTSGEYRAEASAPSYKTLRTHFNVVPGSSLRFSIMLDPESEQVDSELENIRKSAGPDMTLLHGYVLDDDTGKPLSGATVRLQGANAQTQSDQSGKYLLVFRTPQPTLPDGGITDSLSFEKAGFKTIRMDNFELVNGEMSAPPVNMQRGVGTNSSDATHKLRGGRT